MANISDIPSETVSLIDKLAQLITLQQNQLITMQQNSMITTPSSQTSSETTTLQPNLIPIKLDGKNYSLWSQSVKMCLKAREKTKHITDPPPPNTDPIFKRWDIDDTIVKGWICNSLDTNLYGKFLHHPTAKEVWDAIATMFYDRSDAAQVFDLNKKVNRIRQAGRSVEEYYNELQDIWLEIDFRRPNQMVCTTDIEWFDKFIKESRVYAFLDGLDDKLDNERANVLQMTPFPTLEQAFARVRKEATQQHIMKKESEGDTAMISRGQQTYEVNYNRNYNSVDKSSLKCTHCGQTRHTKEQCFQLVGYPDWFKERRKGKNNGSGKGRAAVARTDGPPQELKQQKETGSETIGVKDGGVPQPNYWREKNQVSIHQGTHQNSFMPQQNQNSSLDHQARGLHASGTSASLSLNPGAPGNTTHSVNDNYSNSKEEEWILDTSATDHMTYTSNDLINSKLPRKDGIINANGMCYPVTEAGDVAVYPNLTLQNTLVVPTLSSKLISIGQLTKELNCVVHIFPDYCIFQDIQTKRILGHGTRKRRLYYLDNLEKETALLSTNTVQEENKILLWHK